MTYDTEHQKLIPGAYSKVQITDLGVAREVKVFRYCPPMFLFDPRPGDVPVVHVPAITTPA
jgi:hypothetical protein